MKKGREGRRGSVSSESIDPKKVVKIEIPQIPKSDEAIGRIEECIAGHLLFTAVDYETRQTLILSMSERHVGAGERVITQGEDGDFFYIVDEGTLDCYVKTSDVPEPGKHVLTYTTGKTFGELALMYNTPRAATIIAKTDAKLWRIEREVFRVLILTKYVQMRVVFEEMLAKVPLLQAMDAYERNVLADSLSERTFYENDEILEEGDEAEEEGCFFILTEGECSATQLDADGNAKEVKHYVAGDYFGELALLRSTTRQATVSATTDGKCIVLSKESFGRMFLQVKEIIEKQAEGYPAHL